MAEKKPIRAIKGVRDILPPESALWNRVEETARRVFASYGYGEIRLPIFEQTELFARSVGADTDIVSKEMYTFVDHAFGRLESLRNQITEDYADWLRGGPPTFFLYLTKRFINQVQETIDSGELELGSEESATFAQLRHSFEQLDRLVTLGQFKPSDETHLALRTSLAHGIERFSLGLVLSLRPEATASVCRAYTEHGMHTLPGDVKLYYIGPMFRRERPQKGRYRQFYQIGAEVLGPSDAPAIDAELIEMLMVFFEKAGLGATSAPAPASEALATSHSPLATLYINSIGCPECRPKYVAALRAALEKVRDKLGPDSQRRIETNPLRVLDSKLESEQAIIEKLPRIGDHLCDACREHFAKLKDELKLRGIAYEINWRLVRGLDYYTRTTFEITAAGLGAQNAVCGGGRYDGLVELLGGPPTKGIGFAIGTDRLILSLQESARQTDTLITHHASLVTVFIAWMGAAAYPVAVRLARRLREAGLAVELPYEETKLKKALGQASKLGARYAVIVGEDEVRTGQFTVKTMATGEQQKVTEENLVEAVTSGT